VVHMAPSPWLRRSQTEDGRVNAMGFIRPFYPTFVVFIILGPRGKLVL
jgi:hypothetical protein